MEFILMSLILGAGLPILVHGYSSGAPETICINHFPHHHHLASQDGPSPYRIELSSATYKPGAIIEVRLHSPTGETFKGYQVRAEQVDGNTEQFIGAFTNVTGDSRLQAWYPDQVDEKNCFTHTNNEEKTEVIATWRAPQTSVGDVIFRGTFLMNFETFWANVTSDVLTSTVAKAVHYEPFKVETVVPEKDMLGNCGKSKSCFLYPRGCDSTKECSHALTFRSDGDTEMIHFEMFVKKTPAYVNVGFSHDLKMGEDNTVECVAVDGYRGVHLGYSPAYYNERHKLNTSRLNGFAVERIDDAIYCTFQRSFTDRLLKYAQGTHEPYYVDVDITKEHYLQLAWGGTYPDTPIPWKHDELPLISKDKVDLMTHKPGYSFKKIYASAIPDEYRVHSSLGVTGWVLIASLAMVVSRHFKGDLVKSLGPKIFAKPIWFHVHFWGMLSCMILAIAGVIVIFVYLDGWTKYADIHAIFGLIVVGLGLLNVLGGFLRPDPDSKYRPIFLWAHRISAVLAFIGVWVTVLLGARISTIETNIQSNLTTIFSIWLAFLVVFEIVFEIFGFFLSRKDVYKVDEKGDNSKTHPLKWILLVGFILISLALFIAFLYFILTA